MTALTLDLVKSFLRYEKDNADQDETLALALEAGVGYVEQYTGHALRTRQFVQPVKKPGAFATLDYWPVSGEPAITFWQGDDEQTLPLRLFGACRPATVRAATGWPSYDPSNPATIAYTAGYGDPEQIPAGLLHGVLLYAGAFDRLRDGDDAASLSAVHAACWPYRRIAA